MTLALFGAAKRLDAVVRDRLGKPYSAVLGVGLVIEIVHHARDAWERAEGISFRSLAAIALFGLLLLHELAELSEHVERRRERRAG